MSEKTAIISGLAYVLPGTVTADEILGTAYMSFDPAVPDERRMLGVYALADRRDERNPAFIEPGASTSNYSILIAGDNFGAGSARAHSAIALHAAGVIAIVARSYNEAFARFSVNAGLILPLLVNEDVTDTIRTGDSVSIDPTRDRLAVDGDNHRTWLLEPSGVLIDIVSAGGLVPWVNSTEESNEEG